MQNETNKIVLFTDGTVTLDVAISPEKDTVWLNRQQMALLFDRDIKTIGKHINNAIEEELNDFPTIANFATVQKKTAVVANFATTAADGKKYMTSYYNLDVIISVGYRVKSKRGIAFRKWANSVLKQYIMQGYAVNNHRLEQLNSVIQVMKRTENQLEAKQVLSVIEQYTSALDLLDDYDHQCIKKPEGKSLAYKLTYSECMELIAQMSFGKESDLFGKEKDDSFIGSIGDIYQTFEGNDVYPTLEEKAANLLYFITKNYSFLDGNKRIAAAVFIYFLDKNNIAIKNGIKTIADQTLVAIIIMIAESKPEEKDTMVKLVMNFLIE